VLPDSLYPELPYPGTWPPQSYVHHNKKSFLLVPSPSTSSGWTVAETQEDLESYIIRIARLDNRPFVALADRIPILAYGSNINPSKISWQRSGLGMPSDPVIVLYASTSDLASVWCTGLRRRDKQRCCTLTCIAGAEERYAIWLATDEQVKILDRTEGRPDEYTLVRLEGPSGCIRLDGLDGPGTGLEIDNILAYIGFSDAWRPLLVKGKPVRTRDVPQAIARTLTGVVQSVEDDPLLHEVVEGDVEDADRWGSKIENIDSESSWTSGNFYK
jgi:hypothetical protein